MCGLIASFPKSMEHISDSALRLGLARMRARGPDGEGIWQGEGALLGHRRLAILDLDERANQPMLSPCGRYVMVFNGEIYNFRELRRALQQDGVAFATESDSEVILALYAREGESLLAKLRGMFAFVIWDTQAKRGFAARDPYGIKPLYYAETGSGLWFASQVKALLATKQVSSRPSVAGHAGFLLFGSVQEPDTWYQEIRALPAGHYLRFGQGTSEAAPVKYWDIAEDYRTAPAWVGSKQTIQDEVRAALLDSVAAHMVSDVPVAVFLSGGIDSGSLAGLMVESGARELHGITVGFSEFAGQARDEVPHAKQIADHYGIRHHIRWVSRQEFMDDLPLILEAMDQPSIDGVNTWFASKAVAELGLKVVVSGVGGDELFQGYSLFGSVPKLVRQRRLAAGLPGGEHLLRWLSERKFRASGNARWLCLPRFAASVPGAWALSRGLYAPSETAEFLNDSTWGDFDPSHFIDERMGAAATDPRLAVSQLESSFYMRNQLLRDSDWASMAHSVELRTPLVDACLLRRLQPFLGGFRNYPGKALLSGSVRPALPISVLARAKTGFGVPMGQWLNGQHESNNTDSKLWAVTVAQHMDEKYA